MIISGIAMAQDISISNRLYESYNNYREPAISKKKVKHADILPLIEKLRPNPLFKVKTAGKSVEGRDIYLISAGNGPLRVMLWSQMHGDESTATMAIFDIFNFLSAGDEFNPLRQEILSKLTLYFVPMLNPDGAERFRRRNALDIDINRDAARLQSPEAVLLKSLRDSLNPEVGFNLHDQSPRYSTGRSHKPAVISFLAPPFNYEKEVNPVRQRAMQLIVHVKNVLSRIVPGHIAKYSDDFEPRAFGDNIQKWGTSTILIESGGWVNDPEKQFVRKLNFISILSACASFASGSYKKIDISNYYSIPNNENYIFDLLLRNLTYKYESNNYRIDLGINRYEESAPGKAFYYRGLVEDTGDLSVFYGSEELDLSGMTVEAGKVYPQELDSVDDLLELNFRQLLSEGYTAAVVKNIPDSVKRFTALPLNIRKNLPALNSGFISPGKPADFIIKEGGNVRFAVVNGFIYDLKTDTNRIINSLVIQ